MALSYYDKALDIAQNIFGNNHPKTARVYESLGRFYGNRIEDIDQAIEYYNKGVEIYKNLLIEKNPTVAWMYLGMAGCYKYQGKDNVSNEYLEKGYEIYNALGIRILQTDGTWK